MADKGQLVVVTGPSGVGKSTILREALQRTEAQFSISATTRRPRPTEQDHREYHFIDTPTFEGMVEGGEMLEWAKIYGGEMYGTPAGPVLEAVEAGKTVVLEIDLQGALQVAQKVPGATFVLIAPPDAEALRARLDLRGTETPEQIEERLATAQNELTAAQDSGLYTETIINDDREQAIGKLARVIDQREQ